MPEYDGIIGGSFIFSSDGKRVAYNAWNGDKQMVVVDSQPGPKYDVVLRGGPTFHDDGTLEFLAVKKTIYIV